MKIGENKREVRIAILERECDGVWPVISATMPLAPDLLNFECRLWHYYLLTERSPENKRRYLDTFISGDLEDERACATPATFPLCNLDRTGAACSTAAESRIQGMPGTTA